MQFYPLKLVNDDTTIDFMAIRRYSFGISLVLSVISIILLCTMKLNLGIDFAGGLVIEARTQSDIAIMRTELSALELGEVSIQTFGQNNDVVIRLANSNDGLEPTVLIEKVKSTLSKNREIEYRKTDFVGPQVGKELIGGGVQAMVLAFLAIMAYIWVRFEWQFGLGVLIALLHDAVLALGFMSFMQFDFNLSSIAGILIIIGYSVNDSVVIYDRIRENLRKFKQKSITEIINLSLNDTLSRTTLTVTTTLIANLALIMFGGEALRGFSMLVFFGITVGTYSSIFISAPILTVFKLEEFK